MASSIFTFGSHIPVQTIHFGNLEPVAHSMHSALMVMFRMPIMAPCFAVFGRGITQPYCADNPDFLAIPTVEVQEVVKMEVRLQDSVYIHKELEALALP